MNAVLTQINGPVARVTLNRPDIHNAFDDQLISELTHTLVDLDQNPSVRVLVLQSEGKSFCAGADLNWMKRMVKYSEQENFDDAMALANMLQTLNDFSKPTIARVQGAAFGGGVGLVACCDLVVATERASFCLSEVKLGLTPATISPFVIEAMGKQQARRYFLTAERFSAQVAQSIGLVHEVVAEDQLAEQLDRWIELLLMGGPGAQKDAKGLINLPALPIPERKKITSEFIARQRTSAEGQEGLTAFFDKRSPNWLESL